MSKYEPYSCIDLTAALEVCTADPDDPESASATPSVENGKLLLVVTTRGVELVRVPKVLH